MSQSLSDRIKELLAVVYAIDPVEHDEATYQDIFSGEGERKTQWIIDKLTSYQKRGCRLDRFGYLCIGGADGSELESILKHSSVAMGVMIEISDSGAEQARKKAETFKNKSFKVMQGDATQRLGDALQFLHQARKEGRIDGLIVSAQAVLHELPSRSPGFDLNTFFGSSIKEFHNLIFFSREPVRPENWPNDDVEISLAAAGVSGKELAVFASLIRDRMRLDYSDPVAMANEFVKMHAVLAVETLHKLLRSRNAQEFMFELGEQLTRFDTAEIQATLDKHMSGSHSTAVNLTTEGFEEVYSTYQVVARRMDGYPLPIPQTHVQIAAKKCTLMTDAQTGGGFRRSGGSGSSSSENDEGDQQENRSRGESDKAQFSRNTERLFRKLKVNIAKVLMASESVMMRLAQALSLSTNENDPPLSSGEYANKIVDCLLERDFVQVKDIFVEAYLDLEEHSVSGARVLAKVSRLVLPWLYVVSEVSSDKIECWGAQGKLTEVLSIPAGLCTTAAMIMSGLDRQEVKVIPTQEKEQGFPFDPHQIKVDLLPEAGIASRDIDAIRTHLYETIKIPGEAKTPAEQVESIAIQLEDAFKREGIRYFVIRDDMPEDVQAARRYQDRMQEIQNAYPAMAIVALNHQLLLRDQRLINEIMDLLLSEEP